MNSNECDSTKDTDNQSCPGLKNVASGTLGHHSCQGSVQGHQITPLPPKDQLDTEQHGESPTAATHDGVDNGKAHNFCITLIGDGQLQ